MLHDVIRMLTALINLAAGAVYVTAQVTPLFLRESSVRSAFGWRSGATQIPLRRTFRAFRSLTLRLHVNQATAPEIAPRIGGDRLTRRT